jgi:uncharacterized membrane protein AbrB (regulator of aidB expression)
MNKIYKKIIGWAIFLSCCIFWGWISKNLLGLSLWWMLGIYLLSWIAGFGVRLIRER